MSSKFQPDRLQAALTNARLMLRPVRELWFGFRSNSIPWAACGFVGLLAALLILFRWDSFMFHRMGIEFFYPRGTILFSIYSIGAISFGFVAWATYRATLFNQFERKLETALLTSGLKNRLGRTPRILRDFPIDVNTRKLRITSANFPKKDFEAAKPALETGLQVYIDEIKEDRGQGCFDIIYSKFPMPSSVEWAGINGLRGIQFRIGKTRSKDIKGNLRDTPHLLVAGQTGGGKSTFLRQMITTLYLKNEKMDFILIDLKGGLEFQLFENLERVKVVPSVASAINDLKRVEKMMNDRMGILKENKVKDIDALATKKTGTNAQEMKPKSLNRMLLVIDEATEMFLAGSHASATEIQKARRIMSQVARQGRAVGVHLIIATQRPDVRALDPQIKANLTGVLCFPMSNDASSMTVLGNGRATDLPVIPGRALWKSGIEMTEVQTPFLTIETSEALLAPLRKSVDSLSKTHSEESTDMHQEDSIPESSPFEMA
ncbi:MAG: FtsK/SpoIIIE domain-containing protein [Pseudomonadota bacterium]